MALLFLAIFLIVFGLNIIVGLSIPRWVIGILALVAGLLLIMGHFRVRVGKNSPHAARGGGNCCESMNQPAVGPPEQTVER